MISYHGESVIFYDSSALYLPHDLNIATEKCQIYSNVLSYRFICHKKMVKILILLLFFTLALAKNVSQIEFPLESANQNGKMVIVDQR